MKANEGTTDRIIRAILGIVLLVVGFFVLKGTLGTILGIIAIILLVTALIGFCPLYTVCKLNTKKSSES